MPGYTPLSDSTPEDTHNPSLQGDAASIGGTWSVEMEERLLSTTQHKKQNKKHTIVLPLSLPHTQSLLNHPFGKECRVLGYQATVKPSRRIRNSQ